MDIEFLGNLLDGDTCLIVTDDDVYLLGGELGAAMGAVCSLLWLAIQGTAAPMPQYRFVGLTNTRFCFVITTRESHHSSRFELHQLVGLELYVPKSSGDTMTR